MTPTPRNPNLCLTAGCTTHPDDPKNERVGYCSKHARGGSLLSRMCQLATHSAPGVRLDWSRPNNARGPYEGRTYEATIRNAQEVECGGGLARVEVVKVTYSPDRANPWEARIYFSYPGETHEVYDYLDRANYVVAMRFHTAAAAKATAAQIVAGRLATPEQRVAFLFQRANETPQPVGARTPLSRAALTARAEGIRKAALRVYGADLDDATYELVLALARTKPRDCYADLVEDARELAPHLTPEATELLEQLSATWKGTDEDLVALANGLTVSARAT